MIQAKTTNVFSEKLYDIKVTDEVFNQLYGKLQLLCSKYKKQILYLVGLNTVPRIVVVRFMMALRGAGDFSVKHLSS